MDVKMTLSLRGTGIESLLFVEHLVGAMPCASPHGNLESNCSVPHSMEVTEE